MEEYYAYIQDFPNYVVWRYGNVENLETCEIVSNCKPFNKRKVCYMSNDNITSKMLYVHLLVTNAFVPNPEGHKFVRPLNNNWLDTRAENLYWSKTLYDLRKRSEHKKPNNGIAVIWKDLDGNELGRFSDMHLMAEATGSTVDGISDVCNGKYNTHNGYIFEYDIHVMGCGPDLPGEEWAKHPVLNIWVSTLGRTKKDNEFEIKQSKNTNGYMQIRLNKKSYRVHRLVCETFLENPNNLEAVNHKNKNRTDNRLENLEWVENPPYKWATKFNINE